jgi:hypothetical protein
MYLVKPVGRRGMYLVKPVGRRGMYLVKPVGRRVEKQVVNYHVKE